MSERDAVQQTLDVARNAVGRHDEGGVHGVDVAARYRAPRMPDQGRDRRLGEPEVIADTGEAVPQNMRRDAGQISIFEQLRPLSGEGSEWRVILPAGKDVVVGTLFLVAAALEIFEGRQTDWTHRCALLAVGQPKATAFGIDFATLQTNDLASPAAGQGDHPDDLSGGFVLPVLNRLPKDIAERAIFGLAEPASVDLVLRLANAMHGVLVHDAELDSISENPTEQTDRPGRRTGATSHDGASAQLVGLDVRAGLSGHDVFHGLGDVGLRQIPHPSIAEQRDDVPLDATHVGGDRGWFLGAASLSEHQTIPEIFEVAGAEFFDGDGLAVEFPLLSGVAASRDLAEQNLASRLASSGVHTPCRPIVTRRERPAARYCTT